MNFRAPKHSWRFARCGSVVHLFGNSFGTLGGQNPLVAASPRVRGGVDAVSIVDISNNLNINIL